MDAGHMRATCAAFLDLDKTVLATASSMALRDPLVRAGLITRRGAAVGILIHLPYLLRGADERLMERMRESLGDLARGWDATVLESTVTDALTGSIDPVCYTEALDLIALHHAAGHAVVIASASVEQMVRPIATMLGADHAIGSVAEVDRDNTFTGRILHFNHGEEKARACARLAQEQGWDLAESFAYSDSVTDLPLLELVGHPVAVNPDRGLREAAQGNDWQVLSFTHTVRVRTSPARMLLPLAVAGLTVCTVGYTLLRARRTWA
ncbi:MAG: HAD family hydrolase [Pauljensenia sp.]